MFFLSLNRTFNRRWFNCVDDLVRKYELTLVAGNFFYTQYDPCLEPYRNVIINSGPYPPYLKEAANEAILPQNPYE